MSNEETINIVNLLINNKNMVIGKARQTGKSSAMKALYDWQILYKKYERRSDRKETIKRLFNI